MSTKTRLFSASVMVAIIFAPGCNQTRFSRGGQTQNPQPNATPGAPTCTGEVQGVDLLFLVDNSSSNADTDCPGKTAAGTYPGQSFTAYKCSSATNREKAVLQTFDYLKQIGEGKVAAQSQLAVVSFPSAESVQSGSKVQADWLNMGSGNRAQLEGAMQFTRSPVGMTPYGDGLNPAKQLFSKVTSTNRPKRLILITDGEPTDRDPNSVKQNALSNFRSAGIPIILLSITGSDSRAQRVQMHQQYLQNQGYSNSTINALLGLNGEKSLADSIADEQYFVSDSSKLQESLQKIIKNTTCK